MCVTVRDFKQWVFHQKVSRRYRAAAVVMWQCVTGVWDEDGVLLQCSSVGDEYEDGQ